MLSTGQTTNGGWVVGSGLKAGDRVIVEGVQKVRAGGTVKPVEASPAAAGAAAAPSAAAGAGSPPAAASG